MRNIKLYQLFFWGVALTFGSCRNYESNAENTQAHIFNTQYDLTEAYTDLQADYEAFKMKINEKVTENEARLSELKTKAATKPKEQKLLIAKKIAKLEIKNNNLKTKLQNYTKYDSATWESFKNEVEKSSDDLQKEIGELHIE